MSRLLELMEERGQLRAQCAVQRQAIAAHAQSLHPLFTAADRVQAGVGWVRSNPAIVALAVGLFVLLKPGRVWRWGRKGWVVWQVWRGIRQRVQSSL